MVIVKVASVFMHGGLSTSVVHDLRQDERTKHSVVIPHPSLDVGHDKMHSYSNVLAGMLSTCTTAMNNTAILSSDH